MPETQALLIQASRTVAVVIQWRSGSGKTTFLQAFNRLNEYLPQSENTGSLRLKLQSKWRDIYRNAMLLTELQCRVGMVFQTPHLLPASVADNLALPVKLGLGLLRRDIPARVEWALKEVHQWEKVKNHIEAPAHTLSGGQQQRLCLAGRLADEALIFREGSVVRWLSWEDLQAPDTLQVLLEEIF